LTQNAALAPAGSKPATFAGIVRVVRELVNAGHSTTFASFTRPRAPNAADPASVIRSTTCVGGIDGARGGCGWSTAGTAGGNHTVGRTYLLAGIGIRPAGAP
jgi:hypothetical protein